MEISETSLYIGLAGAILAILYLVLIPIVFAIESLINWILDGEYEYRHPIVAVTAHIRGLTYVDYVGAWVTEDWSIDKENSMISSGLLAMSTFGWMLVAIGVQMICMNLPVFTACAAGLFALVHLTRFLVRVSKKLEIHIKKGH